MKKTAILILCLIFVFCFSSCSENTRPDMTAFSEKLGNIREDYAFDYFDAFIYEDAYHIYYSLSSENDVLLSLCLDSAGNIDSVTVFANRESITDDAQKTAFAEFADAVVTCFCDLSEKEKREKNEVLSYLNTEKYFEDIYETYSSLRYNFVFSSNGEWVSLFCEYYEIMEVTNQ